MAVPLTGEVRKRGKANEARSAVVRERVLDLLGQLGARHGDERRAQQARDQFLYTAIRVAKDRDMRLWKDETHTLYEGAKSGLEVLLGEKRVINRGTIATGVNSSWVLDIWEATLDHYFRDPIFKDRAYLTVVPEPLTDEQVEALNADGPSFIAVPKAEPTPRALSMRVLEAYLARDEETFMALLLEVEELERGE